jgi:ubiquinone/menaquinone biosynthesis C-methylase UbiE
MGNLDQLREVFDQTWDWSTGGEEWSASWGGTAVLWHGVLLPRLHRYVPTGTLLEIAPGHGRITQHLLGLADRVVLVDLAETCIEHCRRRFAGAEHVEYHVNDGRSLTALADRSVDLAVSWDSLVHADADIVQAYVAELARVLTDDGVVVLHHSNVARHRRAHDLAMRTPQRLLRRLVDRGVLLDVYAWRAPDVDVAAVELMAWRHGLRCVSQEEFTWENGPYLTDAVSVLCRPGSRWDRPCRRLQNRRFRRTAHQLARLYADRPGAVSA